MKRTGFWLCTAGAAMAAWLCVSLYLGPARTPRGAPLPLDAVLLAGRWRITPVIRASSLRWSDGAAWSRLRSSRIELGADLGENRGEHLRCELARVGVLP